jgi:hypothetical protein
MNYYREIPLTEDVKLNDTQQAEIDKLIASGARVGEVCTCYRKLELFQDCFFVDGASCGDEVKYCVNYHTTVDGHTMRSKGI